MRYNTNQLPSGNDEIIDAEWYSNYEETENKDGQIYGLEENNTGLLIIRDIAIGLVVLLIIAAIAGQWIDCYQNPACYELIFK